MSIIGKALAFFDLKKKKQMQKRQKLEKIIEKLSSKARGLKKRYKKATDEGKKVRLLKEHKVISKLLKKSRFRLTMLDEAEKSAR